MINKLKRDYCVFIISYKRADNVLTLKALEKCGYTGEWFIIIGDDDEQLEKYKKNFKDKLLIFKKSDYSWVDLGDNFIEDKKTPVFVRNAVYDLAERIGYEYFFVLDDDYEDFIWMCDFNLKFVHKRIKNLDKLFEIVLGFYKKTPFKLIAFAQGGDFIGGEETFYSFLKFNYKKRKVMNTFLCSVKRRVEFLGRLNDDVNTYCYWGFRGDLFLTIWFVAVIQKLTQQQEGGITENYKKFGTYYKSFMSIKYCPSFIKISLLGRRYKRIHHKIYWDNAVPLILKREND